MQTKAITGVNKMTNITGSLNYEKVEELWAIRGELFKEKALDLSNVVSVDSAGISFLVIWAKNLKGEKLTVKAMPNEAKHLVDLFKVSELFDLE